MTRVRRHRTVAVLGTLVLATALLTAVSTGVAAGRDSSSDLERVMKSGDELAKAGSAKFRGISTQSAGGAGSKVAFDGSFDFAQRAGEYSANLSDLGAPSNQKVRGLLLDGSVLLGFDALRDQPGFEAVPQGIEWLKLDSRVFGASEIAQRDPSASIDALRGASGKVKKVGSEKIRNVQTTHYRVTLDLEKAVANAPEAERDNVRTSVAALGTSRVPADVWIDGKGRLRQLRLRLAGSSVASPASVTFTFFDLGTHVTVTRPDPSTVLDLADILGGASPTTGSSG
jgi:hypothetical protein